MFDQQCMKLIELPAIETTGFHLRPIALIVAWSCIEPESMGALEHSACIGICDEDSAVERIKENSIRSFRANPGYAKQAAP